MENKPVIILGGGLWGGLLAYRLSELHPHLSFQLYERNSSLGGHQAWAFSEKDLSREAYKWIRPFITHSWSGHDLFFPSLARSFENSYHFMHAQKFHEVIMDSVKPSRIKVNNEIPLDIAAREGSFVIDARNFCHYKKAGYRKHFRLEVELEDSHGLHRPVSIDAMVEQKEGYRYLRYFPLSSSRLLIEDVQYSTGPLMNLDDMRASLYDVLSSRGWKVKSHLGEHSQIIPVPMSSPLYQEEGRVITLGGILHDTTCSSLPDAVRLIDLMVKSSFRYGELKTIVKNFRDEREKDRRYFRKLNRELLKNSPASEKYKIMRDFYYQPDEVVHRFTRGELQFWDRPMLMTRPQKTMIRAIKTLFPTSYSGRIVLQ